MSKFARAESPGPPSRLAIPKALRASSSLTNLRVHSAGSSTVAEIPPVPSLPQPFLDSSASSVANLEINDGILIDTEPDTADNDEIAITHHVTDEDSKKSLRDQLRRTLSSRPSMQDVRRASAFQKETRPDTNLNEISISEASKYPPREYFVLTDAGKPVFSSRPDGEDSDNITSAMGVVQALISVFLDDNDKLRCINAGCTRITFLLRPPLYYVCVSSWGEPESVTRTHLEYLHLQIISVISANQLRRSFERRTNFDLRKLLNGSESFLMSMLNRLEFDLAMATSSLHCLKLDPNLRKRIAETLVPVSKMKEILYVLLVARGRVVTLIRPRKHSIHPADIHILMNAVHNPSILNSPAPSSCIPVCLPKFDPSGFLNTYISLLWKESESSPLLDRRSASNTPSTESEPSLPPTPQTPASEGDTGIALICIGGAVDFDNIRGWCDSVAAKLKSEGALDALSRAILSGKSEYTVSELGIPGLRHFIYKSRAQVQITFPAFEDPYDRLNEQRRLMTLYQILHDAIHAKSGQEETLKLQYIRTEKESVMGWITQPFELYISVSPWLPKSAVVGAANSVARWVKKEENKLFLKDAPVF